jgi:hypothetical protein
MRALGLFFSRSIPAYFWLGLAYAIFVAVMALGGSSGDATGGEPMLYQRVETALDGSIFRLPLPSGNEFHVTGTLIFIVVGFLCAWVEVVRATQIRLTGRNDTWSLIVTLIAALLFFAFSPFGTTAFLIVFLVGFGDVLLDRIVGQAVARRDFGGLVGGHDH